MRAATGVRRTCLNCCQFVFQFSGGIISSGTALASEHKRRGYILAKWRSEIPRCVQRDATSCLDANTFCTKTYLRFARPLPFDMPEKQSFYIFRGNHFAHSFQVYKTEKKKKTLVHQKGPRDVAAVMPCRLEVQSSCSFSVLKLWFSKKKKFSGSKFASLN